jgi:hypothetical protein
MSKTNESIEVKTVEELLSGSRAAESFKAAVRELAETEKVGHPAIAANHGAPAVKVLRVVMKLLEQHPELELERVEVQGQSGCSDFRGKAAVEPGGRMLEFAWD